MMYSEFRLMLPLFFVVLCFIFCWVYLAFEFFDDNSVEFDPSNQYHGDIVGMLIDKQRCKYDW